MVWFNTRENLYCGEQRLNTQETELNRILEIIGRIAETTADGDFIYRGEPQHYEKVSSSLWRECEKEMQFAEVNIPELLKGPMLDHLQKQHDISTQTVYNDLHGLIRNQNTHLKECIEVYNAEMQRMKDSLQVDKPEIA